MFPTISRKCLKKFNLFQSLLIFFSRPFNIVTVKIILFKNINNKSFFNRKTKNIEIILTEILQNIRIVSKRSIMRSFVVQTHATLASAWQADVTCHVSQSTHGIFISTHLTFFFLFFNSFCYCELRFQSLQCSFYFQEERTE